MIIDRFRSLFKKKEFSGQIFDPNIGYAEGVPQPEILTDMIDAYQLHPWVYAAVYSIATNFASIEYEILKKQGNKSVEDLKHEFNELLKNPNPYMSGYDLKEMHAISMEMTGNSFWKLERDNSGKPFEIWPVPTHLIKVVTTTQNPVDHYVYEIDGRTMRFEYDDVIHFKQTNPKSRLYGQSSILAARTTITSDLFASTWNKNFFKNSGRPDAVLQTEKTLDAATTKRVMSSWKQLHQGVANAHKTAILESGLKYQALATGHKDMDFINLQKQAREIILAVFGVPPSMVGVLEYANYANMDAQKKVFWMDTMLPKIRKFESTLTLRARDITFRDSYFQAETSVVEALRPDLKMLSEVARNFISIGVPLNQAIDSLDLPFEHVDGGDVSNPLLIGAAQQNQNNGKGWEAEVKKMEPQKEKHMIQKFNKEDRSTRWKKFDQEVKDREDQMLVRVRAYFRSQHRRVKKSFQENAEKLLAGRVQKQSGTLEINLIFDEDKERNLMLGVVEKPLKNTFFEFAKRNSKQVNSSFNFDLQDPISLAWIDSKKFKISREANQFTRETLTESVVEAIENATVQGFKESETIAQIADRIDEIYEFAVEGRAERIARTEIISASNAGAKQGMKVAGATKKEWLATADDKTRDTHRQADEQVVRIDEPFIVGNQKLDFPGDPNADPGEIVNCRCTILPVIDTE